MECSYEVTTSQFLSQPSFNRYMLWLMSRKHVCILSLRNRKNSCGHCFISRINHTHMNDGHCKMNGTFVKNSLKLVKGTIHLK